MEILASDANLVTFSVTVLADEHNKKYIKAGSLIDETGAVVKEVLNSEEYELSSIPVGILYNTVDVTYGDAPASIIVEGYLRED